ncbi:radical SAM protein [candidate division TA06 bacterium]|uniref:Radical SAM protein n=1 Tax=candidate division TA06 bacterium TaxID=2250710 RepID=A0A523XLU6_UNCT6|nr:MAG: radical SAM protein [candidate division TA06 bacterium]
MDSKNTTELLEQARRISWDRFGKKITFYLPGMFTIDGKTGRYPALSITGSSCALNCDHCGARILETMINVSSPEQLIEECETLAKNGALGCLVSGGSNTDGRLPWDVFAPAIREVKEKTGLFISVHTGLLDGERAHMLKEAGIDQALIDVVGDQETFSKIYHIDDGFWRIEETLAALKDAGIETIPHIVVGLNYGEISGEYNALELVSRYGPACLVMVVFMPIAGTKMESVSPPSAEEVAELIAAARLSMPNTHISLGCARPRSKYSERLEELAVDAGVNRMALWSEKALDRARRYGLDIQFAKTCCSFPAEPGGER